MLPEANAIVAEASVVGYHCTRLVDHEVGAILASGMKPLSVELVQEQVTALLASGYVPANVGGLLLTENAALYGRAVGATTRDDMVRFLPTNASSGERCYSLTLSMA